MSDDPSALNPITPHESPIPLRLLVGLGNPGREYERTRHNIGFMILDEVAKRAGVTFQHQSSWRSEVAASGALRLCKPMSFMNLSGEPVSHLTRFFKIGPAEMLVVLDDTALPLGKLRLRTTGSAGGHNGMQSIIDRLGTAAIPRLRVGIGSPSCEMTSHVLGRFSSDELPAISESITRAVEAIDYAQTAGLEAAMNKFN